MKERSDERGVCEGKTSEGLKVDLCWCNGSGRQNRGKGIVVQPNARVAKGNKDLGKLSDQARYVLVLWARKPRAISEIIQYL